MDPEDKKAAGQLAHKLHHVVLEFFGGAKTKSDPVLVDFHMVRYALATLCAYFIAQADKLAGVNADAALVQWMTLIRAGYAGKEALAEVKGDPCNDHRSVNYQAIETIVLSSQCCPSCRIQVLAEALANQIVLTTLDHPSATAVGEGYLDKSRQHIQALLGDAAYMAKIRRLQGDGGPGKDGWAKAPTTTDVGRA